MISSSRQLKDKVRNISDGNSNKASTLIRNFMMERFLERVSISSYRDNFILKGGMLVASIVGVDMRATMDIDTTVKALLLNEADVQRIIEEICNIPLEDNVSFQIKSTRTIMEAVEEQLKHAKSKEEADRIISSALSGISKNDPDREYIFAAVNRISTEFHKSGAYEKLPNTVEEGDKEGKESGDIFSDADDKEDDGFDLKNWSPLREVYDSMPTFSVGV